MIFVARSPEPRNGVGLVQVAALPHQETQWTMPARSLRQTEAALRESGALQELTVPLARAAGTPDADALVPLDARALGARECQALCRQRTPRWKAGKR
jgi:hypothetical protein